MQTGKTDEVNYGDAGPPRALCVRHTCPRSDEGHGTDEGLEVGMRECI